MLASGYSALGTDTHQSPTPTDMLPAAATDPSARIINEGILCATMVRAPAAAAAMISCIRDAPFPHLLVGMQDPPMFNGC